VGVEKVDFSENGGISGDSKCLGGSKISLEERPEAILFFVFPAIEFFNSYSPYHQPNARWGKYAATKWVFAL
jgi:hypothetical protein